MLGLFEGAILSLSGVYMSSNRVLPLRLMKTDIIGLAIRSTLYSWIFAFIYIYCYGIRDTMTHTRLSELAT
jgi:hypothetical protein